ncbi:GNAT family N-acetyltransferase [Oceanobacillus kimchii]|uniref:GNAT family N-acetyltransferase n=1 Tax=Oceanobacillus kimchii TaxID=746691 RepID=UPI003B0136D9
MLHTTRLTFRPYCDDDFPFLQSLLQDPEVVRFIGDGSVKDDKASNAFLQWVYDTYKYGNGLGLHVLINKQNERVGHAGLVPQTVEGKSEIEIGYWIAKNHWGKGYATEAAQALFAFARKNMKVDRVISLIQHENTASCNVAKKLMMKVEKEIILKDKVVCVYSVQL